MKAAVRFSLLLGLVVLLSACSSGSSPQPIPTTVGEVYQMVLDSPGFDSDGDGIPDDVELDEKVGTNPNRADSDSDGVLDSFEVFGESFLFVVTDGSAGELHEDAPMLESARDPTDTGEEHMVDSDGDGVYNYLEFYGYIYDWQIAEFVPWTEADRAAHPEVEWFQTDPLQYSTDQDAYSDGMEVSGVRMDVAVRAPGNHPLVPAYPNIVVHLEGYSVTLNDQVTYARGGSVAQGTSWSHQAQTTASFGWSTGGEGGVEVGKADGFHLLFHYNQSWGIEGTYTDSTSVTVGSSVNEEINWNKARCFNTTEAAHVKLFLRVENHGSAPASHLEPTINLRIGGANVATFKQPDFNIHLLMPGESYPADPNANWVVDSTPQGPLALTEHELKALEGGAPISISVSQLSANVMKLNDEGVWEPSGDVAEYTSRCQVVGANLFADLGDGTFKHHWTYACDAATAPTVTLGDALRRTFGLRQEGAEWIFEYVDGSGEKQTARLSENGDGWTIHTDADTKERMDPNDSPFDVRLVAGSHVELVPPRDESDSRPTIYSAYATPLDEGYDVVTCVRDYDGIKSVEFVDRDGTRTPMEPDGRGPWFFSCRLPNTYEFTDVTIETVEVRSVNDDVPVAIEPVEVVYTVLSEPPLITRIVFDTNGGVLKAKVLRGGDESADAIDWVRLFHDDFKKLETKEDRDGYLTMEESVKWFEEPDTYACTLPNGIVPDRARIVAKTTGGLYAASGVAGMDTIQPYRTGTGSYRTYILSPYAPDRPSMNGPVLDADHGYQGSYKVTPLQDQNPFNSGWEFPANYQEQIEYASYIDVHYSSNGADYSWFTPYRPLFGFPHGAARYDTSQSEKSPMTQYLELARSDVEALIAAGTIELVAGEFWTFKLGEVFIFETDQGRYGKMIVTSYSKTKFTRDCDSTAGIEYVVFRKASDYSSAPPPIVYSDKEPYYAIGTKITPNYPIPQGEGTWPDRYYLVSHLSLPDGLELGLGSGVITGTPTTAGGPTTYTIAANNPAGTSYADVTITVRAAPRDLVYTVNSEYDVGDTMTIAKPDWKGDITRFQVAPGLPNGLELKDDGRITGTPEVVTESTTYTVTGSNETGANTTAAITFATPLTAPRDLTYAFNATYTVGDEILESAAEMPTLANPVVADLDDYPLTYEFKAGGTVPTDFELDSETGAIHGRLDTAGTYTFTVVVSNDEGSDEYDVSFTVNP